MKDFRVRQFTFPGDAQILLVPLPLDMWKAALPIPRIIRLPQRVHSRNGKGREGIHRLEEREK